MVITFCGHSNYSYNAENENLMLSLFEEVIGGESVEFFLGGYGGFDAFAYRCAKKYKAKHANAKIILVTPYIDKWLEDRKDYLQHAYDEIVYPNIENAPKKFAVIKRNEWMVNQSDYIFCYVETHYGGAYKTLLYAFKHGKKFFNLYQGKNEFF